MGEGNEDNIHAHDSVHVPPSDVVEDLFDKISRSSPKWVQSLYGSGHKTIVEKVRRALKREEGGRLVDIPSSPCKKSDVVSGLQKVIELVLEKSIGGGETRKVVDSHRMELRHWDGRRSSSPALAIQATGPSFQRQYTEYATPGSTVGYTNVATVFEVMCDSETDDNEPYEEGYFEVESMAVYAKEIFRQQPNRRFIRVMLVTETRFRIVQFDREGALFSPLVNYHGEDLNTFIRAIICLCSTNEDELGLDTSVKWKVSEGRKVSGTVTTFDEKSNTTRTYTLQSVHPTFARPDIHGRGTVCWAAKDPDGGADVLIKDAWLWEDSDEQLKEEYYYLEKAKGVPGVMQMVEYEDRKGQPFGETDSFRPPVADNSATAQYYNRVFRRIVLVKYGADIGGFKSQLEFICALRDAIQAHMRLFNERRVLHRDISSGNILLGLPGASVGYRGILIDLDHAIEIPEGAQSGYVWGISPGTRISQPYYSLMGSENRKYRPIHDYLDDLEAFFHVMYILMHQIIGVGKAQDVPFLVEWQSDDAEVSAAAKRRLLDSPELNVDDVPQFWSEACKEVLSDFHKFAGEMLRTKEAFVGDMTKPWDVQLMRTLNGDLETHYARILGAFDKAIKALTPEPTVPSRNPLLNPAIRPNKRIRDRSDEEEEEEQVKRLCYE